MVTFWLYSIEVLHPVVGVEPAGVKPAGVEHCWLRAAASASSCVEPKSGVVKAITGRPLSEKAKEAFAKYCEI